MDDVYYTKLGEGRRVAIPAEVCEQLGLQPGDPLAIKVQDHSLQLVPYEQIIREVQEAFAPYRQPGVSAVDELIRERRREAAREDAELEASARPRQDRE
jgi:AbrB family looped-hinge helix DNA binding protein